MQRLRRRLWRQDVSCVKAAVPTDGPRAPIDDFPDWPVDALANLDFNLESMEEELTCPVCLELYADPLMLPCSHSTCKKCLQDILDNKLKRKKMKKDLVLDCPSCRKEVHLSKEKLEGLPRNLVLENVVIKYSEEKSRTIRKSLTIDPHTADKIFGAFATSSMDLAVYPSSDEAVNCDLCEDGVTASAIWHCVQCEVSYCQPCFSQYHPRRGALARHKIRHAECGDLQDKEEMCCDHGTEIAGLFCDKCKTLICHLCLCEGEGQHAGHVVLAPDTASKKIKEAFNQTKEESDGLLATMIEQKCKVEALSVELNATHNESVSRIEKQFLRFQADLIKALELEKKLAMQKLVQMKQVFSEQTQLFKSENDKLISELEELSVKCHDATDDKKTKEILGKAADLPPLGSTLKAFQQKTESVTQKYIARMKDKSIKTAMQTSTTDFGNSVLNLYSHMFQHPPEATVPHIMSPVPGGNSDLTPRVQNKCLTTWGFTSTTFTAEKLTESSTWTVNVEKNMSQMGSLTSGYLFGIGVSFQTLGVKTQVGVTPETYALVCSMGQLQFGGEGRNEEVTQLECLPMTVTLTVNTDHQEYTMLTYRIESCSDGQACSLVYKKILKDPGLKQAIYPVFTVSQRVKMLFPTCV